MPMHGRRLQQECKLMPLRFRRVPKARRALAPIVAALAVALAAAGPAAAESNEVNVYTYREAKLMAPLFEAFSKETGIKVVRCQPLEARRRDCSPPRPRSAAPSRSSRKSPVDLGIAQPLKSELLDKVAPPQYRDPDGRWYAISARARVVYASRDRVPQNEITYEELADPKWKGKICIRSGQHIYNNALFAAFIAHHGEAKTEEWLTGLKANLAQKPSGGDREVARDIAAGKCDVGLGNTYYWALMLNREPDKKAWAEATKVILPTFRGGGTHMNVSGVVLLKSAPNKDNAMKLIEWLMSEQAQKLYADLNYEYPVRASTGINPTIAGYGELNADPLPMAKVAENKKKAATLVDKVGFDN
jgi:iron(III) transport system substrate-binding protein